MGKVTLKQKIFLLENIPKKKCRYCKSKENLTYDHKIPLIQGGTSELKNIQVLCEDCNNTKSSLTHGQMMNLLKWARKITKMKEQKIIIVVMEDMVEVTYIKELDKDTIAVMMPDGKVESIEKRDVYSKLD